MKKFVTGALSVFLSLSVGLFFVACGDDKDSKAAQNNAKPMTKLVIGATSVPHAQILELIKDDLKADGVDLSIKEYDNYITPNESLADKSLDANFMQHLPYLEAVMKERNYKFIPLVSVHIEPMRFYSDKVANISDLKEGSKIGLPNDATNLGRALLLLESNNLISLKDSSSLLQNENDVVDNPKKLKLEPVAANLLPSMLSSLDGAVINNNFALQAGMDLSKSLLVEDEHSPYVNIVVVREGEENDEKFVIFKRWITSQKVKDFINEKYKGAVVPAF